MPRKIRPVRPLSLIPVGRNAERSGNRLRLMGLAALTFCLIIAANGLIRQHQGDSAMDHAPRPWTPQR